MFGLYTVKIGFGWPLKCLINSRFPEIKIRVKRIDYFAVRDLGVNKKYSYLYEPDDLRLS